jgi:hypothetical protein
LSYANEKNSFLIEVESFEPAFGTISLRLFFEVETFSFDEMVHEGVKGKGNGLFPLSAI